MSWQNSLLCLMGELAWGGTVAVAVGVSDTWQVTGDTQHVTHDTWNVTSKTWHVTHNLFFFFFSVLVRFGIGATIRTRRENLCLLYTGFSLLSSRDIINPMTLTLQLWNPTDFASLTRDSLLLYSSYRLCIHVCSCLFSEISMSDPNGWPQDHGLPFRQRPW